MMNAVNTTQRMRRKERHKFSKDNGSDPGG